LIVGLVMPRQYLIHTIFERRDDVAVSNLVKANSPYSFETLRRSLVIDLLGYYALGQAVEQLGLTADMERDAEGNLTPAGRTQKQRLLNKLSSYLNVTLMEKSPHLDLVQVQYKGPDRALGARLIAQLTDNYIVRMRSRINEILTKSVHFFETEANRAKERAATLEARLLKMSADHPGIDPADPDLLSQRIINSQLAIEKTSLDRAEVERQLAVKKDYLHQLEASLPGNGATTRPAGAAPAMASVRQVPNPKHAHLCSQIEQVQAQITDARALRQMTDQHPYVVSLRGKLERLREALAREPALIPETARGQWGEGISPNMPAGPTSVEIEKQRVRNEIASLEQRLVVLDEDLHRQQARLAQLEKQKAAVFERRQQYLRLQQDLENAKADHRSWKKNMDEVARILAAEQEDHGISFAVVEAARQPRKPISPTVEGIFLLAAGIGLALAATCVFLREVFDRSVRDPARISRLLGLPILEAIGRIHPGETRSNRIRRLLYPTIAGLELAAVCAAGILFVMSLNDPEWYDRIFADAGPIRWVSDLTGA